MLLYERKTDIRLITKFMVLVNGKHTRLQKMKEERKYAFIC